MYKAKFIFVSTFVVCLVFTLSSMRFAVSPSVETAIVIAGEPEINSPDDIRELTLAGYVPYDVRR